MSTVIQWKSKEANEYRVFTLQNPSSEVKKKITQKRKGGKVEMSARRLPV